VVPVEAGVEVLRRLVGAQVEAPVEVERRRLEPVALAEAVGEPLERVARCVDADEVAALAGRADLAERRVGVGDRAAFDAFGGRRLGVVEQERVVGDERALLAQLAEQRGEAGVVDAAIAGQSDAAAVWRRPSTRSTVSVRWSTVPAWRTSELLSRMKSVRSPETLASSTSSPVSLPVAAVISSSK
jgi:hypothetical protein